jgi:hypothetical protein
MANLDGSRTFRFVIDVRIGLKPANSEVARKSVHFLHEQALLEALLARPQVLSRLVRSEAIFELETARRILEAEYVDPAADQLSLSSVIDELESNVQRYFTVEQEDSQFSRGRLYSAEPFAAAVASCDVRELP